MDSAELRETFDRVNAYRRVTDKVRATAGRTIFGGGFMLFVAYLLWSIKPEITIFIISYAILGLGEFAVGLWKRVAPSVECVLADAIINLLFGGSLLLRQALLMQNGPNAKPHVFSLIFGVWTLFTAYQQFMEYLGLKKAFVVRPSRQQMAYVADMIADIRDGDARDDATILDFSRELDFKAQLLGDHVFILDRAGHVGVLDADDFVIHKSGDGHFGHVVIAGDTLPPVPLAPPNWRNYCQWKGVDVV